MSVVFAKIQMRRGTAAQWAAANPVLAQGELAFETDTGLTKVGDGATAYASLPSYATYDQMLAAKEALDEAALDVAAVEASRTAAAASAATASTKANEAAGSAAAALASEQSIVAKVNQAEQARIDAIAYAAVAEEKADEIVASANAAAADASAADADRIAAEAARTGAEAAQAIAQGAAAGALASEVAADASADVASGAAASALAIYGSVDAQNTAVAVAQAQASLAAGFAASAASVVQQDLSGVTAQALHRSPNAVTAMFIYDTSKDSDGGAWTEKCQHTSWWNEPINGKWLGAQESETAARYQGATLGPEQTVNGGFDTDTTWTKGTGWSIASGVAAKAAGASAFLSQPTNFVSGKTYRFEFTVSGRTAGNVGARLENAAASLRSANGTFVEYITTNSANPRIILSADASFNGSVDNVSVREVTAVTTQTGDYFQLSTDGRFYRLNAGSGVTEVFRGNKRDFPRLAGIVAEASSITIYDLTEPGRPMWMRFFIAAGNGASILGAVSAAQSLSGVAMSNARLVPVGSQGGAVIDFCRDLMRVIGNNQQVPRLADIANRNSTISAAGDGSTSIAVASTAISAVAMTVLPEAPVDPVTGLRVPTIAVATNGGVSLIRHNGVIETRDYNGSAIEWFVQFNDATLFVGGQGPDQFNGAYLWNLRDGTVHSYGGRSDVVRLNNDRGGVRMVAAGSVYAAAQGAGANLLRSNKSGPGRALLSRIAPNFNTGWMTGDLRRCFLSDTEVGALTGPELLTNGGFDTDLTGWYAGFGATDGTFEAVSGRARVSVTGTGFPRYVQAISGLTVGAAYEVSFQIASATGAGDRIFGWSTGSSGTGGGATLHQQGVGFTGTRRFVIYPTASTIYIWFGSSGVGSVTEYDNISLRRVDADRSYRAAGAAITGTLTRAQLASGTSLVGYSGFSAANYLREPYSADLDFGTGEWTGSAWVNVPAALTNAMFPVTGAELVTNGALDNDSGWGEAGGAWAFQNGRAEIAAASGFDSFGRSISIVAGRSYLVELDYNVSSGSFTVGYGSPGLNIEAISTVGVGSGRLSIIAPYTGFATAALQIRQQNGATAWVDNISVREVSPVTIFDRAAATGPRLRLGVNRSGQLTAEAFDGTTTRTVTTSASYNTTQWLKTRVNYTTDGTLAILVNGREVAATRGAPLLTLNNASAVLTIGNSFALDAPFPGSIALLKLGATVPTPEQATFMFEQEKQLFRAGALSVLPDSGAIVDMAYDDATDRWVAMSATNESYWTGLVRNSVQAVPAGSFSRVVAGSGLELAARTGTNPGVDVTIPAYGLREELVRRAEAAARLSRELVAFDFVGGFTANTTNGSAAITNVAGLTYPGTLIGARVSGAGIPANTRIVGVSGTTIYLSAVCTATATGVSISFLDFNLPVAFEARAVLSAGALRREGSTADYTRLYDGFLETIRFAVAPGATAWVQIQATRGTMQ